MEYQKGEENSNQHHIYWRIGSGQDNIFIENTHEAIVSKIVFDRVQCLLSGKPHRIENAVKTSIEDNPLKGKVVCGNCGGKLQRKRGAGNAD